MIFISGHQSAEVVQPSKQALDFPAVLIPAQLSAILGGVPDAIVLVRRDHVDTLRPKLGIQPIAVVGAVPINRRGKSSTNRCSTVPDR